jgi:Tol biopolymer transport system component/DNA-binding winged helix-turn-helix (wHTH) protein
MYSLIAGWVYTLWTVRGVNQSSSSAQRSFRFGLFELDVARGELRKQGRVIKLQDQPFQVLDVLVRRPGEVVTREELQQAVWPADTFVEFDQGLNTAVKKIRLALGDSAENPRFVETIPRKGYRFIVPVERSEVSAPAPTSRRRTLLWAIASFALTICAGVAGWWLRTSRAVEPVYVPVPLTSYPGYERLPSFSPDGSQVAFVWRRLENLNVPHIYLKLIGTDDPVRLTRDESGEFAPAWSPDGRFIAFVRSLQNDQRGVFLIPAIGGSERRVAEVYDTPCEAPLLAWHPGGKWFVVADKDAADRDPGLFLLSVDNGEKRRLTTRPPGEFWSDCSPAVSPNGRAVAFARMVREGIGDLFLFELSADLKPTGALRRLTFLNQYTTSPAWTPDGRGIVFSSGTPHSPTLYKIGLSRWEWQPNKPERLAFAGEGARQPAISRQGHLAYTRNTMDANIWRMQLNGGRPPSVPPAKLIASTHLDHTPQYSPDGKRIVFGSNRSGSFEIWVCSSDGSGTMRLTSFGGATYTSNPYWSPDGRQIVFNSRPEGHSDVFVISSDGGEPKRLTNNSGSNRPSGWSHDGKWIYFDSDRTGVYQVWKMPARGGEAIQITHKGGACARESPGRRLVYYLKDDNEFTSLWKIPSEGGAETKVLESVCCQNFAVVQQGIYFIPKPNSSVEFFSFAIGRITTIATLSGGAAYGMSVSPDGRWLLYSQYENKGADLMLVENFR